MANYTFNINSFNLDYDANIQLLDGTNISNRFLHNSFNGTGDGSIDTYTFTVKANETFIFDIDDNNFDTVLSLYDSSNNLINANDDRTETGHTGGNNPSFLSHTFASDGTYKLEVRRYSSGNLNIGDNYKLNITYQPALTYAWANRFGTSGGDDQGQSIALDTNGYIYTTGYFSAGTVDFDPGVGTFSVIGNVSNVINPYISKLNSDGSFAWVKTITSTATNDASIYGLATDSSGNVYITGVFDGTLDFDPGTGIANLTSSGGIDIFISKLDSNGNFSWAKRIGGIDDEFALDMTRDSNGNLYLTGYFEGTVDFDPSIGTFNLTSTGTYSDTFVTKLDSNGNYVWAKRLGGDASSGKGITVDNNGYVYTTGYYEATADFNPSSAVNSSTSAGSDDIFISKLNLNQVPTALNLSNSSVAENVSNNTTIGTFSTTDPDLNNTFTYSLVAGTGATDNSAFTIVGNQLRINTFTYSLVTGTGDTDNSAFTIVGNQLQINTSPDYETKNSYDIRVRTTDQGGLSTENTFTINITDVDEALPNSAPTDLSVSSSAIAENQPVNTVVGTFSATDPDADNTFSYSLVNSGVYTDNNAFAIVGNELRLNVVPDYETKNSYNIRVRVTDQGGLSYEKDVNITINNVNDAPLLTGSQATLANGTEDTPYIISVANLLQGFSDEDGNTLSVSNLSSSQGNFVNNNNGIYTFNANYNGAVNFTKDSPMSMVIASLWLT